MTGALSREQESVIVHFPIGLTSTSLNPKHTISELPFRRLFLLSRRNMTTLSSMGGIQLHPTTTAAAAAAAAAVVVAEVEAAAEAADASERQHSLRARPGSSESAGDQGDLGDLEAAYALEEIGSRVRSATATADGDKQLYADDADVVLKLGPFGIKRDGLGRFFGLKDEMSPNSLQFDDMSKYAGAQNTFPTALVKGPGRTWLARLLRSPPGAKCTDKMEAGVVLDAPSLEGLTEVDTVDLLKLGGEVSARGARLGAVAPRRRVLGWGDRAAHVWPRASPSVTHRPICHVRDARSHLHLPWTSASIKRYWKQRAVGCNRCSRVGSGFR